MRSSSCSSSLASDGVFSCRLRSSVAAYVLVRSPVPSRDESTYPRPGRPSVRVSCQPRYGGPVCSNRCRVSAPLAAWRMSPYMVQCPRYKSGCQAALRRTLRYAIRKGSALRSDRVRGAGAALTDGSAASGFPDMRRMSSSHVFKNTCQLQQTVYFGRKSSDRSGESRFVDGSLLVPEIAAHRCNGADVSRITGTRDEARHRCNHVVAAKEHGVVS